ncbi:MAG: adenosylcobinamide amidohydrolase [Candidatus Bathyarchaeia archaeon]
MKTYELLGEDLKLILKDNMLALISKGKLNIVSSAVYNGGFKKARVILNVHVPEDCDQKAVHENPEHLVLEALKDLGVDPEQCVGLITAADVKNFSIITAKKEDLTVSAIVTAGCSFAETAGEKIEASVTSLGTINTIIVIQGNPTESCLMQTFITATEAKTAGLREIDIRSKYSGDLATGTITDSTVIASTGIGPKIRFGGPASKLGQMVAHCTREAVKNAIIKQSCLQPNRSILNRFTERKLPIKEFTSEILKANSFKISEEEVWLKIVEAIKAKPLFALLLSMAVNIDEEVKKGIIPKEFGDIGALTENFKENLSKLIFDGKPHNSSIVTEKVNFDSYPFLKSALLCIIEKLFLEDEYKKA